MGLLLVALLVSTTSTDAEQSSRAAGRGRGGAVDDRGDRDRVSVDARVRVAFSTGEVEVIRQHYAPRFSSLPPGLQKKLARTGALPPGWQQRMEPFPATLERQLPALPVGYARGVFEGIAVIYIPGTSVIVDATVLF